MLSEANRDRAILPGYWRSTPLPECFKKRALPGSVWVTRYCSFTPRHGARGSIRSVWVMPSRVHGIMILGAGPVLSLPKGLPCPARTLTRRRAQQAAPLRFGWRYDRQSSYPHHFRKSQKFTHSFGRRASNITTPISYRRLPIDHRPFEFEVGVAEFGPLISPYSWIVRAHQSEEGLRSCEIHR